MKSLEPVWRTTLSEQVATQMVGMISAGRWKPGTKLPSEAALCQSLKIGRSTLREALKALAFVGIVSMHPGEGTFVTEGPWRFHDRVFAQGLLKSDKDMGDLWETRIILETAVAGLCAERASAEDLTRLEQIVAKMKQSLENGGEGYLDLDVEFHLAIAAGSGNQVITQFLRTLQPLLRDLIAKSVQIPGATERGFAHHVELGKAIRARNAAKARRMMEEHLETFRRNFRLLSEASAGA